MSSRITVSEETAPDGGPDLERPEVHASLERYWIRNLRIMATLTVIWLMVGLGCGVLFADQLNEFHLFETGYPLGFWFAQQGSILGFVLIILVYCALMNRLDARHHAELEQLRENPRGDS